MALTDKQTDRRTWQIYDRLGPEGQFGENYHCFLSHLAMKVKTAPAYSSLTSGNKITSRLG